MSATPQELPDDQESSSELGLSLEWLRELGGNLGEYGPTVEQVKEANFGNTGTKYEDEKLAVVLSCGVRIPENWMAEHGNILPARQAEFMTLSFICGNLLIVKEAHHDLEKGKITEEMALSVLQSLEASMMEFRVIKSEEFRERNPNGTISECEKEQRPHYFNVEHYWKEKGRNVNIRKQVALRELKELFAYTQQEISYLRKE